MKRHVDTMTPAQILGEIRQLPLDEQSQIYEALKALVLQVGPSVVTENSQSKLAAAARALCSDYKSDSELTAFTALDGEDFHAAR